ncbi:MAG: hypothetical protein ACQERB_02925 [Promethearchaeati archaeon]
MIDLIRFIEIYIVQLSIGGIIFLFFAVLILRRSTKNLNKIFSMFFITIAISSITNIIYASLQDAIIVIILHILTYYLFSWAMVYLFIFNLLLLRPIRGLSQINQVLLISAWAIILFGLFPIGISGGVIINTTSGWKPVWNVSFFLYGIIFCSLLMIIPSIYTSIKIFNRFENRELKKRWKFFIIGIFFYYLIWGGNSINNFLANEIIRTVWGIIIFFSFSAIYILYYGVAKQLEE